MAKKFKIKGIEPYTNYLMQLLGQMAMQDWQSGQETAQKKELYSWEQAQKQKALTERLKALKEMGILGEGMQPSGLSGEGEVSFKFPTPEEKQAQAFQNRLAPYMAAKQRYGFPVSRVSEMAKYISPATPKMSFPYGKRTSGEEKGLGYFGELQRPGGGISTELSIGVNIGGKEMEIPTLVPTLDKNEIDYLLTGGRPTEEIVNKAIAYAKMRISKGTSPFAQAGEQSTIEKMQFIAGRKKLQEPEFRGREFTQDVAGKWREQRKITGEQAVTDEEGNIIGYRPRGAVFQPKEKEASYTDQFRNDFREATRVYTMIDNLSIPPTEKTRRKRELQDRLSREYPDRAEDIMFYFSGLR